MSNLTRKLLSLVLVFCFFVNIVMSANALGESNDEGVTFSLSLSETTLEKSEQEQTVTLTIKASQEIAFSYLEYDLICNDAFSLEQPETPNGTLSWNNEDKHVSWMAAADVRTDTLGTVVVTIPANIEAGSYEFKVEKIDLGDDADAFVETSAYAIAT